MRRNIKKNKCTIDKYCAEGMKEMNTFKVFLKIGSLVTINAKHVKITSDNTVFYNDRKSLQINI